LLTSVEWNVPTQEYIAILAQEEEDGQLFREGSVDFKNRDWVEYEDGFGNLYEEFWIGLRSVHRLTSQGNYELQIDYQLKNGTKSYLHYNKFAIGSAESIKHIRI